VQSKKIPVELVATRRWHAIYLMMFVGFTVQAVYLMAMMPVPNDRILIEVQEGNEILKSLTDTSKKLDVQVDRIENRIEHCLPPHFSDAIERKLGDSR
jgi:hypothetical protein